MIASMTMISLEPEVEQLISRQITSGRFRSPSEVVAAGLRLLEQDETWNNDQLESELLRGLESGEPRIMTDSDWQSIGRQTEKS